MHQDGWLIGYGMATARYSVSALERIHAMLAAAFRARSCLRPGGAGRAGDHLDGAPTAHGWRRGSVRIRLCRRGHRCRSL
jgi:hypothetical protein